MNRAVDRHRGVGERRVDVGPDDERVGPEATIVVVGDRTWILRVATAEHRVDHVERVVARLAEHGVLSGTAHKSVPSVAAQDHVVACVTEDRVVPRKSNERIDSVTTDDFVVRGTPRDRVIAEATVEPIGSGITTHDLVLAVLAADYVALLAAPDLVVAGPTADRVVAADRLHIPRQASAVVAIQNIDVVAAATVDDVVAVLEYDPVGHVTETDVHRLGAGDGDAEVGSPGVEHRGRRSDREATVGEGGGTHKRADAGHEAGRRRRERIESVAGAHRDEISRRIAFQAQEHFAYGAEVANLHRVGSQHGGIEPDQVLGGGQLRIERFRQLANTNEVDLVGAHDHRVTNRIEAGIVRRQQRTPRLPHAIGNPVQQHLASPGNAQQRGSIERVECD